MAAPGRSSKAPRRARRPRARGAYPEPSTSTTRRLRPTAELEALFAPLPQGPAVSYCNTGHLASTNWFVLSEVLERPGVTLYDGSMSEWTGDPAHPVDTGPEPKP
jgi:thiosulfate/3-mercaptopyruvate sulfurtransferase